MQRCIPHLLRRLDWLDIRCLFQKMSGRRWRSRTRHSTNRERERDDDLHKSMMWFLQIAQFSTTISIETMISYSFGSKPIPTDPKPIVIRHSTVQRRSGGDIAEEKGKLTFLTSNRALPPSTLTSFASFFTGGSTSMASDIFCFESNRDFS